MAPAAGPGPGGGAGGLEALQLAFRELIGELSALEHHILEGPNTPLDPQGIVEGYKWIFSLLQVATDTQVWADTAAPRFVDIVGPYKKWGGDNADAYYQFAPLDPARNYRVSGKIGDAVYLSLTVYGGPDDGRYSERIVGSVNNETMGIRPDGTYEFFLGPSPVGEPSITLEPDAVCAITRDYLVDPFAGKRAQWKIEALDPAPPRVEDAADLARRFRAALTFLRDQATIVPLALGEPNTIDEPYPVPTATFGWAAGDAAYAMGSFDLGPDQALVVTGRSPACAFWNLCLWNQLLHTYNYDYERVTINGEQVVYEPDGSWTIVIAPRDPGHPNWVSTAGHGRGRIWLRWFCPEATPDRPQVRVVPLADVAPL
jgi:hypothetical protein